MDKREKTLGVSDMTDLVPDPLISRSIVYSISETPGPRKSTVMS